MDQSFDDEGVDRGHRRRLDRRRDAAEQANGTAQTEQHSPFAQEHAHQRPRGGSERRPDRHLLLPLLYRIGSHTVNFQHGEEDRHGGKAAKHPGY